MDEFTWEKVCRTGALINELGERMNQFRLALEHAADIAATIQRVRNELISIPFYHTMGEKWLQSSTNASASLVAESLKLKLIPPSTEP